VVTEKKTEGGLTWREWVRLFLYWLVRCDPEVMSGCPAIDRFHMQAKAVLLLAVATIAVFAWGAFLLLFWPWYIALPVLCPIIVWIVLIDQFMGSAHWKLQGILRRPGSRWALLGWAVILGFLASNATLALRLGIAAVTSSATAYSATMAMSHATIEAELEKERNEANDALRAKGEAEKQQRWRDMLGADDAAVKKAAAERDALKKQIADARKNRESAAGAAADAELMANCELRGGPGCHRGLGPKYIAALIRNNAAKATRDRAATDLAALEAQQPDAENKYQDALTTFRAREADYLKAAQALDARVARDEVPMRSDPVMAYRALQKIYQSPDGEATRFYSHLMLLLLLTVELSYVLVSEYFGHASIYMARLIARTRIAAAEVAAETWRRMKALHGGDDDPSDPPSLSYRVLPRFGDDD
jgi:Domain of unknown function (DUF4407)